MGAVGAGPPRLGRDLDRIISRTLAYGLLTVLLGGGYALVVLGEDLAYIRSGAVTPRIPRALTSTCRVAMHSHQRALDSAGSSLRIRHSP